MPKRAKEKFKTEHGVFDAFTNRTLFKLISEGHIKGLRGPLSIGKESNVFSAEREDGSLVAVKIYRLENCDFNVMYSYIKDDPRYDKMKKSKRSIIFTWVQREYRNLLKAREAHVPVPTPIAFSNNVLVMEMVGRDEEIAPKLKDAVPKNKTKFFTSIIDGLTKLYQAGLVHADISQFNILNFEEQPVFIDMSQTTMTEHPRAQEYLTRDVTNIVNFFARHGLTKDVSKIVAQILKNDPSS